MPFGAEECAAAALDLGLVSVALSQGGELGLIRKTLHDQRLVLRCGLPESFLLEVGRVDELFDTELRLHRAQPDYDLLCRETDFEGNRYLRQNVGLVPETFEPLEHFVLFGDAARLDYGGRLNLREYRILEGSKLAPFDNSLCHWIVRGRPFSDLTPKHWIGLAQSRRLFDAEWMAQTFGDLGDANTAKELYKKIPALWRRATSISFSPVDIPVLASRSAEANWAGLREFLGEHYYTEALRYEQLFVHMQNDDVEQAAEVVQSLLSTYGETSGLVGALAYVRLKEKRYEEARKAFDQLWINYKNSSGGVRHVGNFLHGHATNKTQFLQVVQPALPPTLKQEEICFYTTIFGEGDALLPVLSPESNFKFICFSDRPRHAPGWDVRVVEPKFPSPNLSAKYYKVLAHEALPEFTHSIFLDGNTLLMGDLERLVSQFLFSHPFVMWRHPDRDDIHREAVAILQSGRHRSKEVFEQIKHYGKEGLPQATGLTEGSFIWRDHRDLETCAFMKDWWREILRHSKRDQLSLGYLFWKRDQKPHVLPEELGDSRRNVFFAKLPHRSPPAAPVLPVRAPVTFLYHPAHQNSGSTVMRGEQLSRMVAEAITDREVSYSTGLGWAGRVLFLTKGFIEKSSVADLEGLRRRGNYLIADFVDAIPNEEKGAVMHAFAAASLASYVDYASRFPDAQIFNLTHHVDPRIKAGNEAMGFCPGYIGEEVNAVWTEAIREQVNVVPVSTKVRQESWLQQMRGYNLHYAVRQTRDIDGFKPFLKGFTAARCGAPIITQKSVGDAVYYLGDDYPYFLPDAPGEDEILGMIDRARQGFGGAEWKCAGDRMRDLAERTSQRAIVAEFKQILRA